MGDSVFERSDVSLKRFVTSSNEGPDWSNVTRIITDIPSKGIVLQNIAVNDSNRHDNQFWHRPLPPIALTPDMVHTTIRTQLHYTRYLHQQADEPGGDDMDVGFLAEIAYEYIKYGQHVSEVYSPPRVAKLTS